MFPEISKVDRSPEGSLDYVLQHYPVKQEDVDAIIGQIEETNKEKKYIDPVGSLMAQAGWEAEKNGVKILPTILAAVSRLEKDIPPGEKKLKPAKYIEFLAKGELTASARAFWDSMINHDEQLKNAAIHAEKAVALFDFLNPRNG